MKTKIKGAQTKLEKDVQATINCHAEDYKSGAKGFLEDLARGGCQSGLVGGLVYYTDTLKFYKKHSKEIKELLKTTLDATGFKSPSELFGDKWDKDDIFAEETLNQNLLTWFGFEETARNLATMNNIEI